MDYRNLLDHIYPPRCPICDRISDGGICDECKKELIYIGEDHCMICGKPLTGEQEEYCPDCKKRRHYFAAGRAVFSYQGQLRGSLYRLKYSGRKEYGYIFGEEMARYLGKWIMRLGISRIVPIPLHPSRKRQRGYNQAALMAREMGKLLDIPVDEKLLFRTKKTVAQKKLTGQQRKANLARAFEVRGEICPGERILLVDDIYTTGSTVDAASIALRRSAKCQIYVACTAIGG
ncbi:MAG: ComF family protein [Clostridiales bacterium]|nr:ComF family protein [Clostridiales bacterium]